MIFKPKLVLLYHRINPNFGIKPEVFKKQIKILKRLLSKDQFLITFDDGFYDFFFYAYPILKEFELNAVIFISPERILNSEDIRYNAELTRISTSTAFCNSFLKNDNSAFLSWGELKAVSDIVDVQSHGLTHRASIGKGHPYKKGDWRICSLTEEERAKVKEGTELTSILVTNYEEAERELKESKEIIEKKLGKSVNSIAFPWGIYNDNLIEIAKATGYKYCFTTERGWNRRKDCKIKRLSVSEKKNMFWFVTRSIIYAL